MHMVTFINLDGRDDNVVWDPTAPVECVVIVPTAEEAFEWVVAFGQEYAAQIEPWRLSADFGGHWYVRTDKELAGPYESPEEAMADYTTV